jgi:hypothetical protein
MVDTKSVIDVEVNGIDERDYPDYVDAFIADARWRDSGEHLTDHELDELNSEYDFVYDEVMKVLH